MKKFDASAYTLTIKRVFVDGEYCFYSSVAEIPDISTWSDTWTQAYEQVIEAIEILHDDACRQGKAFPNPFANTDKPSLSGRITLRMSRSMHAEIAHLAQEDGVSLNQWIVEAVAQRRGARGSSPSKETLAALTHT